MERKYLSGNIRERLQDLMKELKITQSELAAKIEIDVSTLCRFISNATGKLSDENIKKIAKEFEVSTDFLLGVTDIPDRIPFATADAGNGLSHHARQTLFGGSRTGGFCGLKGTQNEVFSMSKIRLFVRSWHRKSCSEAERFSVPTGEQEVYKTRRSVRLSHQ